MFPCSTPHVLVVNIFIENAPRAMQAAAVVKKHFERYSLNRSVSGVSHSAEFPPKILAEVDGECARK